MNYPVPNKLSLQVATPSVAYSYIPENRGLALKIKFSDGENPTTEIPIVVKILLFIAIGFIAAFLFRHINSKRIRR